jgi:hypothetical protein
MPEPGPKVPQSGARSATSPATSSAAPPLNQPDAGHIPMTEELDRSRWTLPPVVPLIIAAAIVAVALAIYSYHGRTRPTLQGKILGVYAVEQTNKTSVLVNIQLSFKNITEKPLWIRSLKAEIRPPADVASKDPMLPLEDEAAPASDLQRYFQAYPQLEEHKMDPLRLETRIDPGQTGQGMMVVTFPLNYDGFQRRQGLRVTVDLHDHPPLILQQ